MTKKKYILILALVSILSGITVAAGRELGTITIDNTPFQTIKAKKGESLFGIAQAQGLNYDTLVYYNPNATGKLANGQKLYYPQRAEQSQIEKRDVPEGQKEITHLVKKGDNVYTIAKMYGITPDDIYAANPRAREGVVPGMELTLPIQQGWVYVKLDETSNLYDIAKQYNSTVEDIFRNNSGLQHEGIQRGETIRVKIGADSVYYKQRPQMVKVVDHFGVYKAEKGDSWNGLAQKFNITLDEIIASNPDVKNVKKGAMISYPVYREEEQILTTYEEDERQQHSLGQKQLYNEVHPIHDESIATIALILQNPEQNRDKDFMRGFLQSLNEMKSSGKRINLKVIDNQTHPILDNLTVLDSVDLVISLFNEFPEQLGLEAYKRDVEVVNVYDVKSDLYLELPNIMQVMTSSDSFNEAVAQYVAAHFHDRFLISVDKPKELDKVSATIMRALGRSTLDLSGEEFADYEFSPTDSYVVFSYAKNKTDATPITTHIAEALVQNPGLDITLFGPTDWVLFADVNQDAFSAAHVEFPSRMYYDENDPKSEAFSNQFKELYNTKPTRMYPQPGPVGYDLGKLLIPSLVSNKGDFNKGFVECESLILPMRLRRNNNWTGFYNPSSLILKFREGKNVEKIIIE